MGWVGTGEQVLGQNVVRCSLPFPSSETQVGKPSHQVVGNIQIGRVTNSAQNAMRGVIIVN